MPWIEVSGSEIVKPISPQFGGQWAEVDESAIAQWLPEERELKAEKPPWFSRQWGLPEGYRQLLEPGKRESPAEMLKPKWWAETGRNFWEWSKDIAKSIPQLAGTIQKFTPPGMAERLAGQAVEGIFPSGEKKGEGPSPISEAKELGKTAWELAKWIPEYLLDFYKDPVKTVRERPGDTLLVLSPAIGRFLKAKVSAGNLLTKEDLTSAFRGTFKEQGWKVPVTDEMAAQYTAEIAKTIKPPKKGDVFPTQEITPDKIAEQKLLRRQTAEEFVKGAPDLEMDYGLGAMEPLITKEPGLKGLSIERIGARRGLPKKEIPEIEYEAPTGAMEHAGEAVSVEAIRRPMEFYIWDSRIKKLKPIDKFAGVDYQAKPHEAVFQKNTITGKLELRDRGEMASLPGAKILEESIAKISERVPGELRGLNVKLLTKEEAAELEYLIGAKKKIAKGAGLKPEALPPVRNIPAIPVETPLPAQKFIDASKTLERATYAIHQAEKIRGAQKVIYQSELGKRAAAGQKALEKIPGEAGFRAALSEHAGELPKIAYKGIGEQFVQADLDGLANLIKEAPLDYWEKLSAYRGFRKVFSKEYGVVPQPEELLNLEKAFGPEFVKTLLEKGGGQFAKTITEALNVPRTLMATADLSFGFRQGVFFVGRKAFWKSFIKQFGYFGSEKEFQGLLKSIVEHPDYRLLKRSPVAMTMPEATSMALREEVMMGAPMAEKIPLAGAVIKASNRAYTGFAIKLRSDLFYDFVDKSRKIWKMREGDWLKEVDAASKAGNAKLVERLRLERAKADPDTSQYLIDKIGELVNAGSGRGKLPAKLERIAPELNAIFFSPRLLASRLNLLNPVFYAKLPPVARKEALKSLFVFLGAGSTMLGAAKLAGAEVEVNPFSSDFGKIKIGNTRIDVWGGFQQYVRTAAQFAWGKTVSATTGKERRVGEGYPELTRAQIAGRFFEYKEAPVLSFAVALLKGQSIMGEELNVPKELQQRVTPMIVQDMIDIYKDDPTLFPVSLLGIFGVGLQSYEGKKQEYKPITWR